MSMWEIEYLVEQTIKLIDTSQATPSEKRDLIGNAYRIQNQFDCTFTHFRVKDILLKNEYIQLYYIKDFPLYHDNTEWFDELVKQDFAWIYQDPQQMWSENNSEIGYWDRESQKIHVDFGTPYYSLHPKESFVTCESLAFGLSIIKETHQQANTSLIYDWTAFMIIHLLDHAPNDDSNKTLKNSYFNEIKSIYSQHDFTRHKITHDSLNLHNDSLKKWLTTEQLALIEFVTNS